MTIQVTSPLEAEVKKWLPNPKQEKFISLPFSIFEAFFGGECRKGLVKVKY